MEPGQVKCETCNGRGEHRVRITYKEKHYYYFSKCGNCYARGYIDWVEAARGRLPGMAGVFCDSHPAGSCVVAPKEFGGCKVYDGHKYISTKTPRGEALWNRLVADD